jgi:hypothetical protein
MSMAAAATLLAGMTLMSMKVSAQTAPSPWQQLNNNTPSVNGADQYAGASLLLTDGTVMVQVGPGGGPDNAWDRLTSDDSGSYVNGSWSGLPTMNLARQYFGSAVLPNGEVYVGGGEYSGTTKENNTDELFNPLASENAWTYLTQPLEQYNLPSAWSDMGDMPLTVLPNGTLLAGDILYPETALYTPLPGYDYLDGGWTSFENKRVRPNEESWVLLPGGYVVSIDCIGQAANGPDTAELYNPNTNAWTGDGQTPAGHNVVNASDAEIGPAILLYDGDVLFVGSTGHNVLYDVDTQKWYPAADFPDVIDPNPKSATYNQSVPACSNDAPGCLEINGKVLVETSPYNGSSKGKGQFFFEYTPGDKDTPGSWASVPFPSGSTPYVAITDFSCMLDLPNGQILFTTYFNTAWLYTPSSGVGSSSWEPTISNLGINPDASYNVAGTQFNGLSETTGFGDDLSNHTNYPIAQFSGNAGTYYGRTFNHSTMGVQTGSEVTSTNFTILNSMPAGEYNLSIVANGIPSDPIAFYTGIYVNAAFGGNQEGTLTNPFDTVGQGVDAAPGNSEAPSASFIFITGGDYGQNLTISTPCSLINNGGGTVTIGT